MKRFLTPLLLTFVSLPMVGAVANAAACHLKTRTVMVNGHAVTQPVKVCDGRSPLGRPAVIWSER